MLRVIVTQPDPEDLLDSPNALFRSHPHLSVVKEPLYSAVCCLLLSFSLFFPFRSLNATEKVAKFKVPNVWAVKLLPFRQILGGRKGSCLKTEDPSHTLAICLFGLYTWLKGKSREVISKFIPQDLPVDRPPQRIARPVQIREVRSHLLRIF